MNHPLTERTRQLIERITDEAIKTRILALFENEGAFYGPPTIKVWERVFFAVIKVALQGSEGFKNAEDLYRIDTRDLLVSAGFADDLAVHEKWCQTILKNKHVYLCS